MTSRTCWSRCSTGPGKRGRKHAEDLRSVVDAMLFRRWSRNGTWAHALTAWHAAARQQFGRAEETPSMVVIDTPLARGASNGDFTFHD